MRYQTASLMHMFTMRGIETKATLVETRVIGCALKYVRMP